jgi:hypothetical protein
LRTTHPSKAKTINALTAPIIPANIAGPGRLGWVRKSESVDVGDVVDSEDMVWDVACNMEEGDAVGFDEVPGRAPVSVIALGKV